MKWLVIVWKLLDGNSENYHSVKMSLLRVVVSFSICVLDVFTSKSVCDLLVRFSISHTLIATKKKTMSKIEPVYHETIRF